MPDKREAACYCDANAGLQLLMLDELQKILGALDSQQRRAAMDALRYIANQVPVPGAAFSTPRGTGGLASSDEMINRLRPSSPTWKLDADFQRLLLSFEEHMPLPGIGPGQGRQWRP
ncbi:TniB family NTP-binding protein [Pseudoxanthomonas mexicana]